MSRPARPLVFGPNPCLDIEWQVNGIRWEEKNSILSERRWSGGKSTNVARWLHALGARPRLCLPLGGSTGKELLRHLRRDQIRAHVIPLSGDTRANVVITAPDGRQMRFNQSGAPLSRVECRRLMTTVFQQLRESGCLVLSGSLPPGMPAAAYAELIRAARRAGLRTFVDCDGAVFRAAVAARPFLVKPNEHELSEWAERRLPTDAQVRHAATRLSRVTGGWVLVTRGRRGALLVNAEQDVALAAKAPRVAARNTLGAGDAVLAAAVWRAGLEDDPAAWLAWSVAAGAAATQSAPGEVPALARLREFYSRVRQSRMAGPRPAARAVSG